MYKKINMLVAEYTRDSKKKILGIDVAIAILTVCTIILLNCASESVAFKFVCLTVALILTDITLRTLSSKDKEMILRNNLLIILLSDDSSVKSYLLWITYFPVITGLLKDTFIQVSFIIAIVLIVPYVFIPYIAKFVSSHFERRLK